MSGSWASPGGPAPRVLKQLGRQNPAVYIVLGVSKH